MKMVWGAYAKPDIERERLRKEEGQGKLIDFRFERGQVLEFMKERRQHTP